jgi:hypothetical protein
MRTFSLLFLSIPTVAFSQATVQNQVLSSSGNSFTVANTTIDFTLGETITNSFSIGSSNFITQGFQQPIRKKIIIDVDNNLSSNDELDGFHISAYPNPFHSKLIIEITEYKELFLEVIDLTGRVIYNSQLSELVNSVDLSSFNSGNYYLNVYNDGELVKKFSIIKHN